MIISRLASALVGEHAPALKRFVPPAHRVRAWEILFRLLPTAGKTATFARWARAQSRYVERQGSPLYAHLLQVVATDIEAQGPCWDALERYATNEKVPPAAASLAFMAAVHHVVLEHRGSALEPYYPSVGGTVDFDRVGAAFLEVVQNHKDAVAGHLQRLVQTNEVARSQVLLGGFLLVAQSTKLPLRVLEFGASAGLNLRWDQYQYEIGGRHWGDPDSPVLLAKGYVEGSPPLTLTAEVVERRGCDLSPIDATSPEGQRKLSAHVWADQVERLEQLRAAFEVAARVEATVDRADAAVWVSSVLAAPTSGKATVIYDTCMMEYLDPRVRATIRDTIEAAGRRATSAAPLAWLHLAPGADGGDEELRLMTWPGGASRLIATCDPYGRRARWRGPPEW